MKPVVARFDFSDVSSKDTAASQVDGLLQLKDRSGVEGGTLDSPDNELCPEIVDNTMPASLVMQFLLLLYRNLLMLRRNYVSCVNSFPTPPWCALLNHARLFKTRQQEVSAIERASKTMGI